MALSYSKFNYEDLETLNVKLRKQKLFDKIDKIQPSEWLTETLSFNLTKPLGSEKSKSEHIVVPILTEMVKRNNNSFTYFSGYNFDVDKELGLKGRCDFILSRSPLSPMIEAPIFSVVEAKNDNPDLGIPQCIAEMVASRIFNLKKKNHLDIIFGAVTIGYDWVFLKLEGDIVLIDTDMYVLKDLPELLGALQLVIDFSLDF